MHLAGFFAPGDPPRPSSLDLLAGIFYAKRACTRASLEVIQRGANQRKEQRQEHGALAPDLQKDYRVCVQPFLGARTFQPSRTHGGRAGSHSSVYRGSSGTSDPKQRANRRAIRRSSRRRNRRGDQVKRLTPTMKEHLLVCTDRDRGSYWTECSRGYARTVNALRRRGLVEEEMRWTTSPYPRWESRLTLSGVAAYLNLKAKDKRPKKQIK